MTGGDCLELPPGFKFHPTDEELVMHYLCRKCASQTIYVPIIAEIDLYKFDPWQLPASSISKPDVNHHPKAISDLQEVIVKGLGFQSNDLKISGFDLRDALVGRSTAYELYLEIDGKVIPLRLLDDVNRWEPVDLPIFQVEDQTRNTSDENGLVAKKKKKKKKKGSQGSPVLPPFQLAGPMELWIQDAKDMRLSLPHHVDAGELKKVILADGAVVTVKGAKAVGLLRPVELDLPLNKTQNRFASGILTLADRLRHASCTRTQLLSLRIAGPTSLTSPKSSPSSNKLKLKRLAPGLVELSSALKTNSTNAISAIDLQGEIKSPTLLTHGHSRLWPLVSINGSNPHLIGLETIVSSVLGSKAKEEGFFRLLRADVSAQTFIKIGFTVEKLSGNGSEWAGYPKWRTKPEIMRMHFEVLAKIDGDKIVPERVIQVDPVMVKDTVATNLITGNITSSSSMTSIMTPPKPFTL
ncbi:hypothetical protein L6452_28003 [Arctium lappa]|uniref:Uncharacterized protein n=1 Tax=Arctium lappa TaxID=4217 RepID=A0ACB8ZY18_ARCLA|nr:hypothetical protein L6452_28003 [Arctium lappa]